MQQEQSKEVKIIEAQVSDLIPDDKNFNRGNEYGESLIEKSFSKFGAGRSVLIDKNNRLIAGNKSTEKFVAGGGEKVIIIETDGDTLVAVKRNDIDLDSSIGREMALADNAAAKVNIVFDAEVIEAELGEVVCEEWGVELSKFESEPVEDDFDTTPPEEPKTVLGDLFEIGEHRLLCGDSTDSDSVAKLMNGEKADMVFTDPPYNVNAKSRSKKRGLDTIKNDNMFEEDFIGFMYLAFKNLFDFSKENAATYVWHNHKCQSIFEEQLIENNYDIKSQIIWVKDIPSYSNNLFRQQHEIAFYCSKHGNDILLEDGKDSTIWNIPSVQSAKSFDEFGHSWFKGGSENLNLHVTQKPIQLPTKALQFNSKTNDKVLDLFLGSGSTMVAAHQLKRKCYGMELDPKYCDVIVKRMITLDPTLTIKLNGVDVTKEWKDA